MSHKTTHIDALLNQPDTQLVWDQFEPLAEPKICPICQSPTRFWYATVYSGAWDYLESLTADRCTNCGYRRFYLEDEDR